MYWKAFIALLARDAHVARRNALTMLLQTVLQPLLFVLVFGRVMTRSGLMPSTYKSILLPGIIAISMMMTGIQAVCVPLITEFQFTKEIEDRLLAPIAIGWVAIGKIVAGMVQAIVSGAVVFLAGWLLVGRQVDISVGDPTSLVAMVLLISLLSAAGGLVLGCSVGQNQVGLLFSLVVAPINMFGCAYYPWSALASSPVMQKLVLLDPLVYACEGLRATLVPSMPHMPVVTVTLVLVSIDVALIALGLNQFHVKSIS